MTTIRDRRGWLSKLRGLLNRGPATTAERMDRVKAELDALLDRDPEARVRHAQGAVSPEGKAALEQGASPKFQAHIARLIGGGDG